MRVNEKEIKDENPTNCGIKQFVGFFYCIRFSDVMDMAKRSQYTLTGLVINAFTDSVILDWNQLGTINPGGDDGEEETMYTR